MKNKKKVSPVIVVLTNEGRDQQLFINFPIIDGGPVASRGYSIRAKSFELRDERKINK